MDTRWKKFKYSRASKTLCVIFALVMAVVFALNSIAPIIGYEFFNGEDFVNKENRSFYSSYTFGFSINWDISAIAEQVNRNAKLREYNAAEAEYVEKAMELYRAEEPKNRLTDEDIEKYTEKLSDSYDHDFSKYPDLNGQNIYYYLNVYYNIYKGDDGYWYKTDFDFEGLKTASYVSSSNMNFGHADYEAQEMLKKYFNNKNYYLYVSDSYYSRELSGLENLSYYAENSDGTVFTNVENGKDFVNGIIKGEGDYIAYEGGNIRLSASLESLRENLWADAGGSRIYILLNTDFTGGDKYGFMYSEYNRLADTDFIEAIIWAVLSFIAMIVLLVMSVRLAGHTEEGISVSFIDKALLDLHFAIMCILVIYAGVGIPVLLSYHIDFLEHGYNWAFDNWFFENKLALAGVVLLVCTIYLLILEFATSVARAVKAERPIIKKTAIHLILAGLFKLIKLIFKHGGRWLIAALKFIFVTVIGGFFKLIGKGIRKLLHLCKLLALKPKRLEKKLVSATVWYTLVNIILLAFIAFNVIVFSIDYEGIFFIFAFLAFVALIALDAYTVRKAVKYLKALDDIIDTSAKREPLPYDTATLPPSLKTLAESLEATNAELQEAVLKAVKDERTKAELITNVSHDLKTPLTSVINYIDLLQKCDIEDETARQYMAVIDEKSARLKRLIEDLIEASKVSTGNVTLNKTKLNLNELASQAIVEETSDIEKNNLQIIFDETAGKHIVYADGTKIYRVFENLLSNARKYSAPYSRIYARVYSDGNSGYFEIKNISKEPLNISAEELTERFVRGDKSRSEEGNGLGLSIARELCKLNGGDLIIAIDGDLFKATVKLPREENK